MTDTLQLVVNVPSAQRMSDTLQLVVDATYIQPPRNGATNVRYALEPLKRIGHSLLGIYQVE